MKYLALAFIVIAALTSGTLYYRDAMVEGLAYHLVPVEKQSVPTLTLEKRPFRMAVPAKGELVGFETAPVVVPRISRRSLPSSTSTFHMLMKR